MRFRSAAMAESGSTVILGLLNPRILTIVSVMRGRRSTVPKASVGYGLRLSAGMTTGMFGSITPRLTGATCALSSPASASAIRFGN